MEYNADLFAWDRLPVDQCEYRVLSNGAVLDIGRIGVAVNARLVPLELVTVTEDFIEEASGYSPQYVMGEDYSGMLPVLVVSKPVLVCKSASGLLLLLDGRQRALRRFQMGCDSIPAYIISETDAYKYGAAGGFGQVAPDGVLAKRLHAATSKEPVGPHVLGERYVLGGTRFVTDLFDKDGQPLGKGRRPERPERLIFSYHIIINALKTWFISEDIRYRKWKLGDYKVGHNPIRLQEIIKILFDKRGITIRYVSDNSLNAIRTTTNYRNRKEFKTAFLSEIKQNSISDLELLRSEYILKSDLLCRGEDKIRIYNRGVNAIRRLASRKDKNLTGADLTRAMFGFLHKRDKNPIVIEYQLLLTRVTGVDFTEFYWDPACARTIAAWWVVVHDLESGNHARLSPQLAESFVQRRVMLYVSGLADKFMIAWIILFQALDYIGQMEKIERKCADILLEPETIRQWLERPAPDVECGN